MENDGYKFKPEAGDWESVKEMARKILHSDFAVPGDQSTKAWFLRVASKLGIGCDEVLDVWGKVERRNELVVMAAARIREGSRMITDAILESEDLAKSGEIDEAISGLIRCANVLKIPFHREIAGAQIESLRGRYHGQILMDTENL